MMRLADIRLYESELHKSVAQLLDVVLLPPAVWTTFPAGWGKLGKATAGRLKGSGLKAGFPDILIFHNARCIGIELKAPDGQLSKDQMEMFRRLKETGMNIHVCRNQKEVMDTLTREQLPVRKLNFAA